jgi:anti-sigma factor RsiW
MDCRTFRRLHTAYIDSELTAPEVAAVLSHIMACDPCAARDVALRRGLMVARSLPAIRPSRGFAQRLHARLAEERPPLAQAASH